MQDFSLSFLNQASLIYESHNMTTVSGLMVLAWLGSNSEAVSVTQHCYAMYS